MSNSIESQAIKNPVSKQEALEQYAPQIEKIRDTFRMAKEFVDSVSGSGIKKNSYYDSHPLMRDFETTDYVLWNYPEENSDTVMNAYHVTRMVKGDDLKNLIISLPDSLASEKELAIKVSEEFIKFVRVAEALFNINKQLEYRFGVIEGNPESLDNLPSIFHISDLSLDNIFKLEELKKEMLQHKDMFESHQDFFQLATALKQSGEAASLQDTSVSTGLRDIVKEI